MLAAILLQSRLSVQRKKISLLSHLDYRDEAQAEGKSGASVNKFS